MGRQRGLEVTVLEQVTGGRKPGLVRDLGATYHAGSVETLPDRPDIVVECTGVGQLVFDLLTRTAPNAITCLAGISSGTRTLETAADAVNKSMVLDNDVVFGSVNANRRHYDLAVDALARADRDWLAQLVTRRVPMADWPKALERGSDDVKVVVDLQAG